MSKKLGRSEEIFSAFVIFWEKGVSTSKIFAVERKNWYFSRKSFNPFHFRPNAKFLFDLSTIVPLYAPFHLLNILLIFLTLAHAKFRKDCNITATYRLIPN